LQNVGAFALLHEHEHGGW